MTTWPDQPDTFPAEPDRLANRPPGAALPIPAAAPWGDPTLTLDQIDPAGVRNSDPPGPRFDPATPPAGPSDFPLRPPATPPFQGLDQVARLGPPAYAGTDPWIPGNSSSPYGPPSPPPPSYPPIYRFPDLVGPNIAAGAGSPKRRRTRGAVAGLLILALLLMASVGFVTGRALTSDNASDSSAAGPAAADDDRAVAQGASPTADQQGPVTEAPELDPDLREDPAAAVHDAVSPAVVQIETASGLGTGFVYDAKGYILTAAHVVSTASEFGNTANGFEQEVTVRLADGTRVRGEVLGSDLNNDVAVVKIEPVENLPVAALALGEVPRVGSIAIAIGSPFGLDQTVTQGIVSAVNRPVPSPNNNIVSMIQTDAAINSGNSGGPLVDRRGRVLGINTQIRTDTGDNNGIGFAVPIDLAYEVAQSLIQGEPIRLGYLGVRTDDPAFGRSGAMVVRVEPGSPADQAGIEEGDLVISVNGTPIRGFEELASIIRATQPGQKLDLDIERERKQLNLSVTVGEAVTR